MFRRGQKEFTGRSGDDIAGGTSARRARSARVTSVRSDVVTARPVIVQLESLDVASAAEENDNVTRNDQWMTEKEGEKMEMEKDGLKADSVTCLNV